MINNILAFGTPGAIEVVIILIILGIPVLLIALSIRYVFRGNKERQRLRLELGKLADELQQMREQTKTGEKDESKRQGKERKKK